MCGAIPINKCFTEPSHGGAGVQLNVVAEYFSAPNYRG